MNDNIYKSYISIISEENESTVDDTSARLSKALRISSESADMLSMELIIQFGATEEDIYKTSKLLMKEYANYTIGQLTKQDVLDTWSVLNEKWRDPQTR